MRPFPLLLIGFLLLVSACQPGSKDEQLYRSMSTTLKRSQVSIEGNNRRKLNILYQELEGDIHKQRILQAATDCARQTKQILQEIIKLESDLQKIAKDPPKDTQQTEQLLGKDSGRLDGLYRQLKLQEQFVVQVARLDLHASPLQSFIYRFQPKETNDSLAAFKYTFKNITATTALCLLSRLKNRVNLVEEVVLQKLKGDIDGLVLRCMFRCPTSFQARPISARVKEGSFYEADILITNPCWRQWYLKKEEYSEGKLRWYPNGVVIEFVAKDGSLQGKTHDWKAILTFYTDDGMDTTLTFHQRY